jgi:hypothetical protein
MIVYHINDMANYIVSLYCKFNNIYFRYEYFTSGAKLNFFSSHIDSLLFNYLYPIIAINILVILYVLLSLVSVFLLFKKLRSGKMFSLLFAFLFSISTYFLFRVISFTSALYCVFVFALVTFVLLKEIKPLVMGATIFLILSLSNYYGFFSFILICFWYLFDLLFKKVRVVNLIKNLALMSLPVFLGIVIFYLPLLKSNLTFSSDYKISENRKESTNKTVVYRPLEDWYNLSFRPWYFFIPPQSSVFFGDLSRNIYKKIESSNYYLADDYMEEEMAGSYMGWHFLLGMGVVASLLLIKKYKKKEYPVFKTIYENQEMIIRSFFIIFCILLISGPPSFTIRGITFYTPSYLLYYIIPVFRTLVRWAVVIYLFVLIINSYLVQDLYNLIKKTWQKVLFIFVFLALNFVIFAIKIPIINIDKPPVEIAYLKKEFPGSVSYAVYPKGDYYSIFWIISQEDLLINPINFIDYKTGFDANEFSRNLITKEGIKEFLTHKPSYLIYYGNKISDDDLEKISKVNPEIKSREDIARFFERELGNAVIVGDYTVYSLDIPKSN